MNLIDRPLVNKGGLLIPANVSIVVRERGKRVPQHCREDHNIWVDLGREYLARVISPNVGFTNHDVEPPVEVVQFMGIGIGGESQWHPAAYIAPLMNDYPPATGAAPGGWGNKQTDEDPLVTTLERPVKLNIASPIWLDNIVTPVTYLNSGKTVRYDHLFDETVINSVGPYTVVPLSEIGLFLSTRDKDAANVYDLSNPPTMVGAGRQTLLAYNTFEAIPKTVSFSLEVRWELRF
jgi:hypothetical protein